MDTAQVFRSAAQAALGIWGRDEDPEDLVQDLWVWYLESEGTQRYLSGLEDHEAIQATRRAAMQILSKQALRSDTFRGVTLYSSEAVKDHLKGRSTNKFLRRIMPVALANLQKQNPMQAEAIRLRYEEGGRPDKDVLLRAHQALTEHVNILVIKGDDEDDTAVPAELRRASGGKSDPTAEAAIALIEKGDEPIELTDEEGYVTGTTTYRTELANVFDDWMSRPTLDYMREGRGQLTVLDGGLLGDRSEMYKAQVFPDVYPGEKPMLIDNWSVEDRQMYCGGVHTPGYLRLVKGDG
ncbi:putative helix-turn-helix DNA binding protein [Mycobacterium phage PP]|uniref:Putative helix-turn-helix DNA binding protein n=1 Tax=Mycobacterium phage PP TaxID=2077134 RepID=A0A2Z5XVI6_9CAUD|nr:sigma-K factor [Mycobacterium phage PP]BBC53847.1 putative helix-turn-helix DNA binding protein [Mycobacterium phage PP]